MTQYIILTNQRWRPLDSSFLTAVFTCQADCLPKADREGERVCISNHFYIENII